MKEQQKPEALVVSMRKLSLLLGIALAVTCGGASAIAAPGAAPQLALLLFLQDRWELILAIMAAVVGGGGLGGFAVRLIMLRPERRKLDVDMIDKLLERVRILDTDVRQAKDEVEKSRTAAVAANARAETAEVRAEAFFAEVKALRGQFAAATMSMAATLVFDDDLRDFEDMWDLLDVPIVFTAQGGRWNIVNVAMCRELGCGREELLGFGWQTFAVDLEDTMREEAAASHRRVWGYLNEYRRGDGSTFWFEWYASKYKSGEAMAFAFPSRHRPTRKRRRDDQPTKEE